MKKPILKKSRTVYRNPFMSITAETLAWPERKRLADFYLFEFTDWVNVLPITPNGRFVMIRQYRHGSGEFTWEVPGGTMDKKERSPLKTAKRELEEETGYTAKRWKSLGSFSPNPAVQRNQMHFFLALDATLTGKTNFDEDEDIETALLPASRVYAMLKKGQIAHSLSALCIYRALETLKH